MNAARVPIATDDGSYDVLIGAGLLANCGSEIRKAVPSARRAALVVDSSLPAGVVEHARGSLVEAGFDVVVVPVNAHEQTKTLSGYEAVLGALLDARLERTDAVVALGGGVVGDLAGFAAATYRRGLAFVQCPTTLLAMVDASIGGKTGINLTQGGVLRKNMAGAFHQPALVIADIDVLASLSDRQFSSGLAECVKHALLSAPFGQPDLFDWTERRAAAIMAREPGAIAELVERNVRIKGEVIAGDVRERNTGDVSRALLNLGHTFGHALETMPGVEPGDRPAPITHGEAVSLGIVAACRCSALLGEFDDADKARVAELLNALGLPTSLQRMPPEAEVWRAMAHDKKSIGGRLHLVLPTRGARCVLSAAARPDEPLAAIASLLPTA